MGLLECARRLDGALETVKPYARVTEPTSDGRAPRHKLTLVDPYGHHLRTRRAEDPAIFVRQLFWEIAELGHTGSLNLLYRYIAEDHAEGDKPVTAPQCSPASRSPAPRTYAIRAPRSCGNSPKRL
ncbi:hypothetical protein [Nonomuraea sp. NPDC049480]|uniref:hypothetical protein n=1 Tax=Nonomuraea sp. NPDC049480 TaxID=3364353 RepID=UPI00378D7BC7